MIILLKRNKSFLVVLNLIIVFNIYFNNTKEIAFVRGTGKNKIVKLMGEINCSTS